MKRAPFDETSSRIRAARDYVNLSQAAFARLVGVSRTAVQYWEYRKSSIPAYVLTLIEHRAASASPEELDFLRRGGRS